MEPQEHYRLKLGIKVRQATVAVYMLRRPHSSSWTWRSFLHNHALVVAAIDMGTRRRAREDPIQAWRQNDR